MKEEDQNETREKAKWPRLILLLLGISIFIMFLKNVPLGEVWSILTILNTNVILIIMSLTVISILFKAWRWKYLVKKTMKTDISTFFSFNSVIAGVAAGSLFPGRIDVAKPLLLKKRYYTKLTEGFSLLFVERVFDLISIIFIFGISGLFVKNLSYKITPVLFIFPLFLLIFLVGFLREPGRYGRLFEKIVSFIPLSGNIQTKIISFARRFINVSLETKRQKIFYGTFMLSFLSGLFEVIRLYYVLTYFGISISLPMTGVIFAVVVIVSVLSLIPGGIGVNELSAAGMILLFTPGSNSVIVTSAVLLNRFFAYYILIIIGSISLMIFKNKKKTMIKDD
ncbi:TPA: flippase-like domain-containing protein [Candidatus Woesearchaeota archaeon]|nr:hypothetical protein [archaeon]HIJ11389.1 flippase-like domain-containing protein [Candidatus Woesearchaeota archaeon]|tara:strand:- start:95 stop:1108 length:1014 start_codon:yes stop_codon:yes gene_type:complete